MKTTSGGEEGDLLPRTFFEGVHGMGERAHLSFNYFNIIIEKDDIEKFLHAFEGLCNAFAITSGQDKKTGEDLKEWQYRFEVDYET